MTLTPTPKPRARFTAATLSLLASALLLAPLARAGTPPAELKQKTLAAFEEYVRLTESRVESELAQPETFLWADTLAGPRRGDVYRRLRAGELVIEHLETRRSDGKKVDIPDGMVHHWVGVVFIPGAKLEQVLALVQDYDHTARHYGPDVMESKLLARDGDHFRVYMRFYRKKVVSAVLNTEHDIIYRRIGAQRWFSRSATTRIAEVEDPGTPKEKEKPIGNDRGFLWRLNAYWRFEEKDGGVYVQSEAVTLSRDIPFGLGWIIGSFVKSVPRESLTHTLASTRNALVPPAPARTTAP